MAGFWQRYVASESLGCLPLALRAVHRHAFAGREPDQIRLGIGEGSQDAEEHPGREAVAIVDAGPELELLPTVFCYIVVYCRSVLFAP